MFDAKLFNTVAVPLYPSKEHRSISFLTICGAMGATVHVGGRRNPRLKGLYFEPTVLTEVNHDMDVMVHETFGPVISIMRVRDDDEALRLANDSEYGLNGNVWTRDKRKALDLASRMETGGVCVNDMALTYGAPEAPFGGRKSSGVGQVNGEQGVRGYCHALPVIFDRFGGNVGPPQRFGHRQATQLRRGERRQGTLELANRGSARGDNDWSAHGGKHPRYSTGAGPSSDGHNPSPARETGLAA